jgi:hypothetical protein
VSLIQHKINLADQMARFFIDTDDGDERIRDEVGVELASREQARQAVLDALPDMARDKMPDDDRRTFRAMARDVRGTAVYRATLTLSGSYD